MKAEKDKAADHCQSDLDGIRRRMGSCESKSNPQDDPGELEQGKQPLCFRIGLSNKRIFRHKIYQRRHFRVVG